MRKALVTLAIGDKYIAMFDQWCRTSWQQYAQRHGYDLIVITEPLDQSERSQARSPSWQKCLILSHPDVKNYDRAVWIDSDILINPNSPDICQDVPIEKVGAIDEYATPSREEHRSYLERLYQYWDEHHIEYTDNLTASSFHHQYGLTGEFQSVVQGGVLAMSPQYHRELMEHIYHAYEDKGGAHWNYEMRPLSYEIQKHRLEHWVSPKFNMPWPFVRQFLYPFLNTQPSRKDKILGKLGIDHPTELLQKCVTTAFLNNYFLHFAGGTTPDMAYVDMHCASVFNI
jgi:hypothetical protein